MTTAAEVKRMVQPLLSRHADLALVGYRIYVNPVEHFVRAVPIGRTAYKELFEPRWAVMHLFELQSFIHVDWGARLGNYRSSRPGLWQTSDPDVELSLIEAIEEQALPILRKMTTLDDFLAFVSQHDHGAKLFEWPECRIILDVALGDLESARAIRQENIQEWSTLHPDLDEDGRAMYRRMQQLCARLAANDRRGMVDLLHQWEAETVKNLKIEHLWKPTPFPLERAGSASSPPS